MEVVKPEVDLGIDPERVRSEIKRLRAEREALKAQIVPKSQALRRLNTLLWTITGEKTTGKGAKDNVAAAVRM